MPFDVRSAISPLAIVVLPEPLVGAAIRNADFISAKVQIIWIKKTSSLKKSNKNWFFLRQIEILHYLCSRNGNLVADAA
jgi:hypothetical protein